MRNRPTVTPREAAALDRLLDAYIASETGDPGDADLRTLHAKVHQLEQDHTAYDEAFGTTGSNEGTDGRA